MASAFARTEGGQAAAADGLDIPAIVYSVDWPCEEALLVVYGPLPGCDYGESTGNPYAVNGRYRGLFQVDGGSLDPYENTRQAYQLWLDRGWQPWSCRPY